MKIFHKIAEESQRIWEEWTEWSNRRPYIRLIHWDRPGRAGFHVITAMGQILITVVGAGLLVLLGRLIGKF